MEPEQPKPRRKMPPRRVIYFSNKTQAGTIDKAAAAEDISVSSFMKRAVLREARRVLGDKKRADGRK